MEMSWETMLDKVKFKEGQLLPQPEGNASPSLEGDGGQGDGGCDSVC